MSSGILFYSDVFFFISLNLERVLLFILCNFNLNDPAGIDERQLTNI